MNLASSLPVIIPCWPAPSNVRAYTTTRRGGVSAPPYAVFNLARHVGDAPQAVTANRLRLRQALSLPREPAWLEQVHGNTIVSANDGPGQQGDASVAYDPGPVCAILTADCLPLLLCDRQGTRVAAVHVGWRGLAANVIEAAVHALACPGRDLLAWLGPAIGPSAFEVGTEVRKILLAEDRRNRAAFSPCRPGRWLTDLYLLARLRLAALQVAVVYGGHYCTVVDAARFYSYRREGRTGRMATLIWLAPR